MTRNEEIERFGYEQDNEPVRDESYWTYVNNQIDDMRSQRKPRENARHLTQEEIKERIRLSKERRSHWISQKERNRNGK